MKRTTCSNSALILLTIFTPDCFGSASAQSGTAGNPPARVPAAVAEAEQALETRKFIKEGLVPTERSDGCELHIWPTTQISSNSSGGFGDVGGILPGIIDTAIHSRQNSQSYSALINSFTPNLQINLLNIASIRQHMLMSEGTTIITHDKKSDIFSPDIYKNRLQKSESRCYFELIIERITWNSTSQKKTFESTFVFRAFGLSQTPKWVFKKTYRYYPFCFFPKPPKDPTVGFLSVCFTETFESSFQKFAEEMRSRVPPTALPGM